MDLRLKTLIIFGVGLILILAGFTLYSSYVLQKSYEDIEKSLVREDIDHVKYAIDNEISVLDATLLDWSSWDDTYFYVQGNNSAYEEENLAKNTYRTLGLNHILIFNRSGDLIYANSYNSDSGVIEPVSPSLISTIESRNVLFNFNSPDGSPSLAGFIFVEGQPVIFTIRPVMRNDGSGPSAGIMMMGRNVDESLLERLSESTGVSVFIKNPASRPGIPSFKSMTEDEISENTTVIYPVSAGTIAGYTPLKEIGGTPGTLVLEITQPRIVYQSGLATIYSFLLIVLIAALIFGILGLVFIDRLILSRVSTITSDVKKIGSGKENVRITEVEGNDELTQLSRAINQMLEKISLVQLRYQSIVEDQTELICRFNPDGHITFMNPAFKRNIADFIDGEMELSFFEISASYLAREGLEELLCNITERSPIATGEYMFIKEGENNAISWSIRGIFDSTGALQEYQFVGSDISTRKQAEAALQQVTRKLTLLNQFTFNDIQNAVFTLDGYLTLEKTFPEELPLKKYLDMEQESVRKIESSLNFAKTYQDLGLKPPEWQNVQNAFIIGISHLDFSSIERVIMLDDLEIYADSLLERVFFTLSGNVLRHAKNATRVTFGYQVTGDGLLLYFEDNGPGIPDKNKEKIFERGYGTQAGMELFLVREILGITGITIRENGRYGFGARFEMNIPKRAYRFPGRN